MPALSGVIEIAGAVGASNRLEGLGIRQVGGKPVLGQVHNPAGEGEFISIGFLARASCTIDTVDFGLVKATTSQEHPAIIQAQLMLQVVACLLLVDVLYDQIRGSNWREVSVLRVEQVDRTAKRSRAPGAVLFALVFEILIVHPEQQRVFGAVGKPLAHQAVVDCPAVDLAVPVDQIALTFPWTSLEEDKATAQQQVYLAVAEVLLEGPGVVEAMTQ